MKRLALSLACLLAVSACATAPTASQCQQAQADLNAAKVAIPGLQAALDTAISLNGNDASTPAVKHAQAALAAGEALLPQAQAAVTAYCAGASAAK